MSNTDDVEELLNHYNSEMMSPWEVSFLEDLSTCIYDFTLAQENTLLTIKNKLEEAWE